MNGKAKITLITRPKLKNEAYAMLTQNVYASTYLNARINLIEEDNKRTLEDREREE